MIRQLFLFGDQQDNFAETSRPFIESAGGNSARVAMLTASGEKAPPYVERITAPWREIGVEIVVVGPKKHGGELTEQMVHDLKACTGIFMCGGDTRQYERLYSSSLLKQVICDMYEAGIPYAGVSAGALMAADKCATWGGIVKEACNEYYVRYRGCYDGVVGDIGLQLGTGLGLIDDCVFEPHFAELGGFPRLLTVMERTGVAHGFGLDEPICLSIEEGRSKRVLGRGRLYYVRRQSPGKFQVEIHEPGDKF